MATWVLRFTLLDHEDQPILIHVYQKSDAHELDLDLIATDGDSAFRGKVRERSLAKHRASSYEGSPEEWSAVLRYALRLNPVSENDLPRQVRDSLDYGCSITGKGSKAVLTVYFRTRIEDISHRLGGIDLQFSENTDDVDLFGWSAQAIAQRDDLAASQARQTTELEKTRSLVTDLENQLIELLQAKKAHEDELLSKFTLLLNEKKLRIRTQQRQIAKQDMPSSAVEIKKRQTALKNAKTRRSEAQISGDESDGFEAMDVDSHQDANDDLGDQHDNDRRKDRSGSNTETNSDEGQPVSVTKPLPQPRKLPFGTAKPKSGDTMRQPAVTRSKANLSRSDDETASEDDEL